MRKMLRWWLPILMAAAMATLTFLSGCKAT
jgi:hypothetical protein